MRLVVLQGEQRGHYLEISSLKKEFVLGRKSDCDLYLQDDLLSRYHCRVFSVDKQTFVEDLQSRNGTFVNGEPVLQKTPVQIGDFISIGAHLLKLVSPETEIRSFFNEILCTRCGSPVPYPQPQPPYICLRCYKRYFQTSDIPDTFKMFGHYQIQSLLGEGGVSSVYLAIDTRNQKQIALKLLKTNSESYIRRFEREETIYRKLSHPNIIHLYDSGSIDNTLYIAMEYIIGENLHEYVCRLGSLSDVLSLKILLDAAKGLAFAHDAGVIHRDIKPGNIMIGKDLDVKVLDFGLAKSLDNSQSLDGLTKAGAGLGSLMYVSPEQLTNAKNVDLRTDIYSLGATLYFMKAVAHPFASDVPAECMTKIQNGQLDWSPIPPVTHPKILEMIKNCLCVDPEQRYETTHQLIHAIEESQRLIQQEKA